MKKATPIFYRGKIFKICILQNIVMIILTFNVFWSKKLIPMVNFTLKCFPGMFMTTPICGCSSGGQQNALILKKFCRIWISMMTDILVFTENTDSQQIKWWVYTTILCPFFSCPFRLVTVERDIK